MADTLITRLAETVRVVPNFPIEGIMFRDITPILSDPSLMRSITLGFARLVEENGWAPDLIAAPESRGFIFGALLAAELEIGFIPIRKPGKLPADVLREEYSLEYGTNILEVHADAIKSGQRILIVDDLLATGGTIQACQKLCERLGAITIANLFVIELDGLGGRDSLKPIDCHSLIHFPA